MDDIKVRRLIDLLQMMIVEYFQYVLNPTYTRDQIDQLDKNEKMVRAYDSTLYLPGKSSLTRPT